MFLRQSLSIAMYLRSLSIEEVQRRKHDGDDDREHGEEVSSASSLQEAWLSYDLKRLKVFSKR